MIHCKKCELKSDKGTHLFEWREFNLELSGFDLVSVNIMTYCRWKKHFFPSFWKLKLIWSGICACLIPEQSKLAKNQRKVSSFILFMMSFFLVKIHTVLNLTNKCYLLPLNVDPKILIVWSVSKYDFLGLKWVECRLSRRLSSWKPVSLTACTYVTYQTLKLHI